MASLQTWTDSIAGIAETRSPQTRIGLKYTKQLLNVSLKTWYKDEWYNYVILQGQILFKLSDVTFCNNAVVRYICFTV